MINFCLKINYKSSRDIQVREQKAEHKTLAKLVTNECSRNNVCRWIKSYLYKSPGTPKLITIFTSNLYSFLLLWKFQLNITSRKVTCTERVHISANGRRALCWQCQHALQSVADVLISGFGRIPKDPLYILMAKNCPTPELLRGLLDQRKTLTPWTRLAKNSVLCALAV